MNSMPQNAQDIMVTRLVTLTPKMDVFEAIGLLLDHQISGAPVIGDDGQFLGVFSERCCMQVVVEAAYDQAPTSEIAAFIDKNPHTIEESTDLLTIVQIFLKTQARRLPVLRDGKLVGQISRRDVLRVVHRMMEVGPQHGKNPLLYLSSLVERGDAPIS